MANDSLMCRFAVGAPSPVIPALSSVIPAKAGIHSRYKAQRSSSTGLDTRLRGYDGVEDDAVGWTVSNPVSCALVAVIPASTTTVIPAPSPVIPAKAGIQLYYKTRRSSSTGLDTRLRGYDGIKGGAGWVDSSKARRLWV